MMKIKSNPTNKELRTFGWVLLGGFGLVGGLLYYHNRPIWAVLLWFGTTLVAGLAFLAPSAAKPFYWVWMRVGLVVGFFMSRLVMTLIFYGLITPVALFFRWRGRDELRLRKRESETYWDKHPTIENRASYEHLF